LRVSMEWLSDFVDIVLEPFELAERLTISGTAVEGIETVGEEFGEFTVGHIREVRPHPSADRLSLCNVDIGAEVMEIVCGAPNTKRGLKVPVALPGSRLPDGTIIRETSIRGVSSRGMILSESEFGISEDAEGIMILEEKTPAGVDLADALGMPDTIMTLEITPNRPDCLSILGVAREVAAVTGQRLRLPDFELLEQGEPTSQSVRIEIIDEELCSRYAARVIVNLTIAESPWFVRRRLQAAGVRPINNVVDITNYVMLELGQPLHAFDYRLVKNGHIIVRRAKKRETLLTLDGVERELRNDDLLICDPSGPIALAGVMGGEHSEVSEHTSSVLLESAHFEASSIMRTSRAHDLSSEASYRFERGVDPGGCVYAADRAASLMRDLAGGEVLAGAVDARGRLIEPAHLSMRVRRAGKIIGVPLSRDEAEAMLRSIEIEVEGTEEKSGEELLSVVVPTFRPDLEREIDLVEEVARLYGYDRIPSTLPETSSNIGGLNREQRLRRRIASTMTGMGLYEAITHSFISPRWLDLLDPKRSYLPSSVRSLRNPISEEMSVMRPTLIPGLLEALRFNLNRRVMEAFLFEIGKIFIDEPGNKLPREPIVLGFVMTGKWIPKQWGREAEEADFYTAKGVLETLFSSLHVSDWSLEHCDLPFLHPTRSCNLLLGEHEAGYLGLIHPRVAEQADLPENTLLVEMDLERLTMVSQEVQAYEEIPRFPSVQMDLAIVVKEGTTSKEIEEIIREAGGDLLREIRLFDLYRGDQIAADEKSLAYNLTFYALDRTLRDEEAHRACDLIVDALANRLGARLR
jgi:phenylalanyl-tRNA synthetase beta chain